MKKFRPFVSCEHPVLINYRTSKMYVPCNSCVICSTRRQQELSNLLQIEERNSKYCNFLTLTYDDDSLPVMDFSTLCTYEDGEIFSPTSCTFRVTWDASKEFYDIEKPLKVTSSLRHSLKMYNFHRHLYQSNYSVTHVEYKDDHVAILYPRDLQLFLKRLRKYISKKYNEKVRYYAIGEYGTQSLRPHWHILLFYNSQELFRDFEDVIDLGTPSRPSPCAKFIHTLWEYGIACTKNTDGKSYYYVSSYVNKSPNFPVILDMYAPQKAYHSLFLGTLCEEKDIKDKLLQSDFDSIGKTDITLDDGSIVTLSVGRSILSRLFPRFSGFNMQDVQKLFRLYTSYPILKKEIGGSVLHLAKCVFDYKHCNPSVSSIRSDMSFQRLMCEHAKIDMLSPLVSVISASKRFCENATELGISYVQYFKILLSYYKWYQLSQLNFMYEALQENDGLASTYYSDFHINANGSSFPMSNNEDTEYFAHYKSSIYKRFDKNIKHRDVADRYKFNF